jgi:hypothetical protein
MVHVCNRWARDHTDDLQFAFFNGAGFESWENVWGIRTGITPRDAEALRRIAKIERSFADLVISPDWRPYAPTLQFGVFASRFPRTGAALWTVVNRAEHAVSGDQLRVAHAAGRRYFDLWHGVELKPRVAADAAKLSFEIEPRGFGAVLALDSGVQWPNLEAVLREIATGRSGRSAAIRANGSSSCSRSWTSRPPSLPAACRRAWSAFRQVNSTSM